MNKPYETRDIGLAAMLSLSVPFPKNEKGEVIPFFNLYTPEVLRRYGYKEIGIEAAARHAHAQGKRGEITYLFEFTELCQRLIKTWNAQSKTIAMGAETKSIDSGLSVDPELAARICCQYATNRKWLSENWRHVAPCIPLDVTSSKRTEEFKDGDGNPGARTIVIGSFKVISLNASAKLRQQVGVKS